MNSISSAIKTILISGSNKGIGFGIVQALLRKEREYNVILTSRNEELGRESLTKLQEEFPEKNTNLFYHQLDISNKKSIDECVKWIKSSFGQIDILINNAGTATKGDKFDIDVFNYTFPTNVYGTIELS